MITALVFWFSLLLIGYVYAGYPLVLWVLTHFVPRRAPVEPTEWPSLSLVISAHNEEAVIQAKLDNSRALDYPREKLEILVVSDASTDATERIVQSQTTGLLRLVRIPLRLGKTNAQNEGVKLSHGEIVVFSDANAMYDTDALKQLVQHFSRSDVGCVEGRRLDYDSHSSAVGKLELTYRDYESRIKEMESQVLSCTGATGPIYAVRHDRYIELPVDMISDFMEPLLIRYLHGLNQVFEAKAISREPVLTAMSRETARKIRIMTRCLNSIWRVPGLLNPLKSGSFAIQIWSHRLLRWLLPVVWLVHLVANCMLLEHTLYQGSLILWALFLLGAGIGHILDNLNSGPHLLRMPFYVFNANRAAFVSILNWLCGRNVSTWIPDRGR